MAQSAPTAVLSQSTSAASTTTLPSSTTAMTVADVNAGLLLAIFVAIGTTTGVSTTTVSRAGTIDTDWSLDLNTTSNSGGGTNKLLIFSKVLTSADLDGSNNLKSFGLTSYAGSGARFQLLIRRHADGWSTTASSRRVDTLTASGASISGGVTMFSPTNSPRATTCIIGFSGGLGSNGTITCAGTNSGSTAHVPLIGSATSSISTANAAYQCDVLDLADTDNISTVSGSSGSANTSHANGFVQYAVLAPSVALPAAAAAVTAGTFGRTKTVALPGAQISVSGATFERFVGGSLPAVAIVVTASPFGRTKTVTLPGATISVSAAHLAAPLTLAPADIAITVGQLSWSKQATFVVGLSTPPKTTYPTRTLRCWAACATPSGVGEIRLALYEASSLVTEGAWRPLSGTTPTRYELEIAGQIGDWTQLRAEIAVRTSSSAIPRVFQVELELIDGIGGAPIAVTAGTFGRTKRVVLPGADLLVSAAAITSSKSATLPGVQINVMAAAVRQVVTRDIVLSLAGRATTRWRAGQPKS